MWILRAIEDLCKNFNTLRETSFSFFIPSERNIVTQAWNKHDYYTPPLQALLLWHSLSLFWFCGLLAAKYPLMGFASMLLFLCIDSRLWTWRAVLFALFLFCLGMLAIMQNMPQRPAIPPWTLSGSVPKNIQLQGEVSHVQSLPDARLRIFLKNVHAVEYPQTHKLAGLTVWTWEQKYKEQGEGVRNTSWTRPLPGQSVRITAKVRSTEGFRNRWSSDFGAYWQNQEVFWRIWSRADQGNPIIFGTPYFLAQAREYVRKKLYAALSDGVQGHENGNKQQAQAFLPALLMYERFGLSEQTMERMRAASLVHSLALSGQHLWLAVYYAAFLVFICAYFFPRIFLYIPKRKLLGLVSLPLALLYLWIGNAPPSLIRAALMLALALFFYWRMKLMLLGHILLCTALCITLYSPLAFYNLSLQLSLLCVGSICLLLPVLRRLPFLLVSKRDIQQFATVKRYTHNFLKTIVSIFCISLAIQCALLPIFLTYFPPSGVWFISNVFWLPILACWVLPVGALGMLFSLFSCLEVAAVLLQIASWPCELLLQCLAWMDSQNLFSFSALVRPAWTTVLAWIPLCLALALLVGRVSWHDLNFKKNSSAHKILTRLTVLSAFLLCIGPVQRYIAHFSDHVVLEVMDVGQGQAVALTLPGGQRLLVDGGGSFSSRFDPGTDLVLPSLVYNTSPRLWAMINTHSDVDHLRGLLHILPLVSVEHFFNNGEKFSATDRALWHAKAQIRPLPKKQALFAGMEVPLPVSGEQNIFLEVLWPPKAEDAAGNNASLILRLVQKEGAQRIGIALLCGDAEKDVLQALLDAKKDISAQVLLLSHHGAKDALLPDFYRKVQPLMAFVSAGRQNAFGHPHYVVRKALQNLDIPLYSTAKSGAIRVYWSRKQQSLHMEAMVD